MLQRQPADAGELHQNRAAAAPTPAGGAEQQCPQLCNMTSSTSGDKSMPPTKGMTPPYGRQSGGVTSRSSRSATMRAASVPKTARRSTMTSPRQPRHDQCAASAKRRRSTSDRSTLPACHRQQPQTAETAPAAPATRPARLAVSQRPRQAAPGARAAPANRSAQKQSAPIGLPERARHRNPLVLHVQAQQARCRRPSRSATSSSKEMIW